MFFKELLIFKPSMSFRNVFQIPMKRQKKKHWKVKLAFPSVTFITSNCILISAHTTVCFESSLTKLFKRETESSYQDSTFFFCGPIQRWWVCPADHLLFISEVTSRIVCIFIFHLFLKTSELCSSSSSWSVFPLHVPTLESAAAETRAAQRCAARV